MHCPQCIVNVCMHETNREERKNLPQGGGSGGGLIGPRNTAQFKECDIQRNPPMTSIIQPTKMMYIDSGFTCTQNTEFQNF